MPDVPFPYPGNKARLSDWILKHIPDHECFVSVFGGAGGILFNKNRSKVEVYNDKDDDLVYFFRVLREREDELTNWLARFPFSRELHSKWADKFYDENKSFEEHINEYCEEYGSDHEIVRAGIFFFLRYGQWGSKYGNNSGFAFSKVTNDADSYANARDRLHEFADRLDGVVIENLDWRDCVEKYDGEDTVYYLDPPYYKDTSEQHYQVTGFNHRRFVKKLGQLEARWILSYAEMPSGLEDYHIKSKESNFMIGNGKSGEAKKTTENLIMNFNPERTSTFGGRKQKGLMSASTIDESSSDDDFLSNFDDKDEMSAGIDDTQEFNEDDFEEFNFTSENEEKKEKQKETTVQSNGNDKANKIAGVASGSENNEEKTEEEDEIENFLEGIE